MRERSLLILHLLQHPLLLCEPGLVPVIVSLILFMLILYIFHIFLKRLLRVYRVQNFQTKVVWVDLILLGLMEVWLWVQLWSLVVIIWSKFCAYRRSSAFTWLSGASCLVEFTDILVWDLLDILLQYILSVVVYVRNVFVFKKYFVHSCFRLPTRYGWPIRLQDPCHVKLLHLTAILLLYFLDVGFLFLVW